MKPQGPYGGTRAWFAAAGDLPRDGATRLRKVCR
jgi:hypothetical protein